MSSVRAPMLPAPLQFILAMIAYAINQRMARQLNYLQEQVRVLEEALTAATGKTRFDFSAEQRRRLAHKGKELTAEDAGAEPELQSTRRTLREDCPDRVPGSLPHLRRTAPTVLAQGIRRALPHRALPPGPRQPDHPTD
jgi:hypothetical protein